MLLTWWPFVRRRPRARLEDETGLVNVICSRGVWVRHAAVARSSAALVVRGRLEKAEGVVNVVAERMWTLAVGHLFTFEGLPVIHYIEL